MQQAFCYGGKDSNIFDTQAFSIFFKNNLNLLRTFWSKTM